MENKQVIEEFEKDFLDTWIPKGMDISTPDGDSRSARERGLAWAQKLYQAGQDSVREEVIKKLPKELTCEKCNGTGSYKIPVSSPIMAPYGKNDTTQVPCECVFNPKKK